MFITGKELNETVRKNFSQRIIKYQCLLVLFLSGEYFVLWGILDRVAFVNVNSCPFDGIENPLYRIGLRSRVRPVPVEHVVQRVLSLWIVKAGTRKGQAACHDVAVQVICKYIVSPATVGTHSLVECIA